MLRYWLVGVVVVAALAVGVLGAQGGGGGRGGSEQGGGRSATMGGMMSMFGSDIASWDGNVYIVRSGQLQKLNADLGVAKSVELQAAGGGQGGGQAGEGGGGRSMGGRMRRMTARLAADAKGVCLLVGDNLTVYDHDLKEVKSKELGEASGSSE